mmetsp:Transcript_8734/g.25011  ORF Transcript_8734/g.25011 Transcript_8734/m.25011 type:complete len:252 (+) Transcript_8734:468-1223(+)
MRGRLQEQRLSCCRCHCGCLDGSLAEAEAAGGTAAATRGCTSAEELRAGRHAIRGVDLPDGAATPNASAASLSDGGSVTLPIDLTSAWGCCACGCCCAANAKDPTLDEEAVLAEPGEGEHPPTAAQRGGGLPPSVRPAGDNCCTPPGGGGCGDEGRNRALSCARTIAESSARIVCCGALSLLTAGCDTVEAADVSAREENVGDPAGLSMKPEHAAPACGEPKQTVLLADGEHGWGARLCDAPSDIIPRRSN